MEGTVRVPAESAVAATGKARAEQEDGEAMAGFPKESREPIVPRESEDLVVQNETRAPQPTPAPRKREKKQGGRSLVVGEGRLVPVGSVSGEGRFVGMGGPTWRAGSAVDEESQGEGGVEPEAGNREESPKPKRAEEAEGDEGQERPAENHGKAEKPAGSSGRTKKSGSPREITGEGKVDGVRLTLDYLVYRSKDPFAQINGIEVHVGWEVDGFKVLAISEDTIRLQGPGGLVLLHVH